MSALAAARPGRAPLPAFLAGASIEVMPRTLAAVPDPGAVLPAGARVFVAHIDGTAVADMAAAVARLAAGGFVPVPHVPARVFPDAAALDAALAAYRAAGAERALVLAGGLAAPRGPFPDSLTLLASGRFDDWAGLCVAGHPEGSRDIDPEGGERAVMVALARKADWSARTGVPVEIVTQFAFEPAPVIAWTDRLAAAGIDLPVRIGLAGPARLQTMIRFAVMCGVGPSLRVLQRRARDVTKLLVPYAPDAMAQALAAHAAAHPGWAVRAAHLFPLGGIAAATDWLAAAKGSR